MSSQGKQSSDKKSSISTASAPSRKAEQLSQLDFELDFFESILTRNPDLLDVLRVHGNNLTLKGRFADGLLIDRRLVELRPNDPSVPHNQLVTFVKDRPGHDRRYAMDTRKIENELQWTPLETFESGIRKTVCWYLEHDDWVRDVTSGSYRQWMAKHYATER